jgi:uncharacterized protein YprB with RNaseH-like and TPR domain
VVAPKHDRQRDRQRQRDKLRRAFGVDTPVELAAQSDEPTGSMRAFLQRRRQQLGDANVRALPRPIVALPDGEEFATAHGTLWRRVLRYPADERHGDVVLSGGRAFDPEQLAVLTKQPTLTTLSPNDLLFLDTETTGLSGGAGTVVFAYGLGFFRGDDLVIEQLFLRDFGEEPALLHHVAARLAEFPVPVTYVGKSFDRHRIAARLALHKIRADVLTERHVDLYHVVRRGFARQWPDCRLRSAEERLLGLFRRDDLPGSEAPAAFLDWLRDRSGPVDRVLEHNRLDVMSLCALLCALAVRS